MTIPSNDTQLWKGFNGHGLYAKRAEKDRNGEDIVTTYAKQSEVPALANELSTSSTTAVTPNAVKEAIDSIVHIPDTANQPSTLYVGGQRMGWTGWEAGEVDVPSGKDAPSDKSLLTLFYGDVVDDNYAFRYTDDAYTTDIVNYGDKRLYIDSSRVEETTIGTIPVFRYGDAVGAYFLSAVFGNGDVLIKNGYTVDFWIKYPNTWGERTIASQILHTINNSKVGCNHGPYTSNGFYYNYGYGGINVNCQLNLSDTWHHFEYDFDYTRKVLTVYIDGTLIKEISIDGPLGSCTDTDFISESRVMNDTRNHQEVTVTQLALWDRCMGGTCYSKGLYHDGNHFLV